MTRRNRRRRRVCAVLLPVPALGAIVLVVTLALVYLWIDHTASALGQQIKSLESEYAGLRNEWVRERNKWASMRTPANLEQALLRHGLVMGITRPEQIVYVDRASPGEARYVAREQWARLERDGER